MDSSERNTIEESLRKLTMAVEQSPESIVITDVTGTIEYVNPKFSEVTGYTFAEAIGQNPRVLKSGETPVSVYTALWETILSGHDWRGEFLNKKKNGELYWESASISPVKDDRGQITHFVAVKLDITERRRVENALRESEEKFRLTFDQSPIGAVVASLDFRFLKVNSEFCRISGYTEQELLALSFPQITYKDDVDNNVDMARKLAAGDISVYDLDKRYVQKDGGITWVRISSRMLRDAAGSPLYYLAMVMDITERKNAEEAIRVKNHELKLINSITSVLNSSMDFQDKLQKVLADTLEMVNADAGAIYLRDEDQPDEMSLSSALARTSEGQSVRYQQILSYHDPVDTWPVKTSTTVSDELFGSEGLTGIVPLAVKGQGNGIMALYCRHSSECKEVPRELLAIGSQVGISIENHRLFKKIEATSHYLSDIVNESPDPIVTTDAGGAILSFNKSAVRLLKYEPGEVIGNSLSVLLPAGQQMDMTAKNGYVRDFSCKDGTLVTVSVSTSRLPMEGTRSGYIVTLQDLSSITGFKVVPITENAIDTDQKYLFEKGLIYLFDHNQYDHFMSVFADQVKHNIQGLCITRHHPKKVREQYELEKTPIVWLTGNDGIFGEICLKPDNLSGLSATVNKFIGEAKDGLILLDGLEYLMMRNNYESLLKYLHFLNDRIMISECRVICCADPAAFDEQQFHLLTAEMRLFDHRECHL